MENIQFEDQQFKPRYQNVPQDQKGMVGWFIKKGIVKNAAVANYILLGMAILFVALTISIFFIFIKKPAPPEIDPNAIANPEFDPALNPDFQI